MSPIQSAKIGELVAPVASWTPPRDDPDGVFTYIDLTAVDQDAKAIVGAREMACADAPTRARQLVRCDDVLVSTVRPNLNAVAQVPQALAGATASTGFCVLRPESVRVDSRYLFHWVRSPCFVSNMVRMATGASYPAVTDRAILESKLPLPSLPEQRRISEILDAADALRVKRRAALAQLDSIIQSAFLDIRQQADEKFRIVSLAEIAEHTRGSFVNGPFGSDLLTSELQDHGVPVIYIRDIRDGEYSRVSTSFVSEDKARKLAVCAVNPGDVLVAKVGDPPGVAAVYPKGEPAAVVTQDVVRIRVSQEAVLPEYVAGYLNSSIGMSKISGITIQATRARFSLKNFKSLKIELPPILVQRKFTRAVQLAQELKNAHRASLVALDALFSALQHRFLPGSL